MQTLWTGITETCLSEKYNIFNTILSISKLYIRPFSYYSFLESVVFKKSAALTSQIKIVLFIKRFDLGFNQFNCYSTSKYLSAQHLIEKKY